MPEIKKAAAPFAAGFVIGLIVFYFARNMDLSSSFALKGSK